VKGSASIEMLAILIVAIYLAAIVYKEVVAAGFQFAEDEYKVAMAKLAADKIANTAHFLKVSAPGTTKKIEITLPEGVALSCNNNENNSYLQIYVKTNRTYEACNKTSTCEGNVYLGLECRVNWKITGPVKSTIAMVKIGGNQIEIGEPP